MTRKCRDIYVLYIQIKKERNFISNRIISMPMFPFKPTAMQVIAIILVFL